jgi:hypothetical protein
MKRHKHRKWRLLSLFLLIAFIIIILKFTNAVKYIVAWQLKKTYRTKIHFDKADINFLDQTLSLKNLHFYTPVPKEKLLFSSSEIKINYNLWSLLRRRRLNIKIYLKNPKFYLEEYSPKNWSLSRTIRHYNKHRTKKSRFTFFQNNIYIKNGEIRIVFYESKKRTNSHNFISLPALHFANINGNYSIYKDFSYINNLSGNLFGQEIKLSGFVFKKEDRIFSYRLNPEIDINNPQPFLVKFLSPKLFNNLIFNNRLKISGNINLSPLDSKKNKYSLSFKAAEMNLQNFKFTNVTSDIKIENEIFKFLDMTADIHQGQVTGSMAIDLSGNKSTFLVVAQCEKLSLASILKKNFPGYKKDAYGEINGNISLRWTENDLSSLKGGGGLVISNGKLWKLSGITNILKLLTLQEPSKTILNEAKLEFKIENRLILSEYLKVWGENLELYGKGHVDFNGNVNIKVITVLSKSLASKLPIVGKPTKIIIDQTGRVLSEIIKIILFIPKKTPVIKEIGTPIWSVFDKTGQAMSSFIIKGHIFNPEIKPSAIDMKNIFIDTKKEK